MKVFRCEMCGSNDLVKIEDMYTCQNCGTKYTLETAKKLLVEIDESNKIQNLKIIAKQALDNEDYLNSNKYYEELRKLAPLDFEIYFYSYYTRLMYVDADNIDTCIEQAEKLIENLGNMFKKQPIEQQWDLVVEYTKKLLTLCGTFGGWALNILQTSFSLDDKEFKSYLRNRYYEESEDEFKSRYCGYRHFSIAKIILIWGEIVEEQFRDKKSKEELLPIIKGTVELGMNLMFQSMFFDEILDIEEIDKEKLTTINYYISIIQKYDSNYKSPCANQTAFNYKRMEVYNELVERTDGYYQKGFDIAVYDNVLKTNVRFSVWKARVEGFSTTQGNQKTNKKGWLWGAFAGLILGILYIVCCT